MYWSKLTTLTYLGPPSKRLNKLWAVLIVAKHLVEYTHGPVTELAGVYLNYLPWPIP